MTNNLSSAAPTTPQFSVPADGPTYVEQVRSRCHNLIQCGIWAGLHIQRMNQWWSNFRTEAEKYFAACLLDSVIYRSEDQTIALMRHLVQRSLPDHGRATGGIIDWECRLHSKLHDPRVRLVPVIPRTSPQGKSAHVILRLFEKRLSIPSRLFASPEDVPNLVASGFEAIVFVDDILGTGQQFTTDFAVSCGINKLAGHTRLVYAPLVAHEDGIHFVRRNLPNVSVASAEVLGQEHAIFGNACRAFTDGANSPRSAWDFYSQILSSRGILLNASARRGFGELELAFFFQHAAPDNSLPIFWWKNCPNWKPLFHR